LARWY